MTKAKFKIWSIVLLFRILAGIGILVSISMNANSAGNWYVSDAGTGPWTKIRGSCAPQSVLLGGDFNGDGKTDVFTTWGGYWRVSYGGTSDWKKINRSDVYVYDLRFGDFNGDGKTDVFTTWGGYWRVSYGGTSKWKKINLSDVRFDHLRFVDSNGDGKTDVFTKWDGQWRMSSGGSKRWKLVSKNPGWVRNLGRDGLLSGNYVGDSRKDKFKSDTKGCPVKSSGSSSGGSSGGKQKPPVNCGGHNEFPCGYPKCGLTGDICKCDAGLNKVNNKCYSCGTIGQNCCGGSGAFTKCHEGYCKSPGNTCQKNP